MRSTCIIFFLFICFGHIHSQDTIYFNGRTVEAVRIVKVGERDIEYNRFDNLEGPLYVTSKRDIHYIKFANGKVDTLTSAGRAKATQGQDMTGDIQNQLVNIDRRIYIDRDRLSYQGETVGEAKLREIILAEPNAEKQQMLLHEHHKLMSYKKRQYLFGFIGPGLGVLIPAAGFVLVKGMGESPTFLASVGAGVAVAVTGIIISSVNKHKRTKQKMAIARLYNKR
ncbi:MAG: hypothetical protein V4580_02120 [Bacteroidota bacterium]